VERECIFVLSVDNLYCICQEPKVPKQLDPHHLKLMIACSDAVDVLRKVNEDVVSIQEAP
jgi:hypothetical protein